MIRRLLARALRVAPPGWAVAVFVVCYLICEGPVWYFQWKVGRIDLSNRFGRRILFGASAFLGAYRVMAFHPYFRTGYLRWLKTTPWTVSKPLPLGPIELVPEDCVAIGLLALLGTTLPDFTSLYVINIFLFANICAVILTFWKIGSPVYGYCLLLFLGLIPQFWTRQWVDFAILTALYLVAHEGLWHALRRFPWESEGFWRDTGLFVVPAGRPENPACGWSFDRFHRDIRTARGVNKIDALLGCMLGAWWLWSLFSLIEDPRDRTGGASWGIHSRGHDRAGCAAGDLCPGIPVPYLVLGKDLHAPLDHSGVRPGVRRPDVLAARRVSVFFLRDGSVHSG